MSTSSSSNANSSSNGLNSNNSTNNKRQYRRKTIEEKKIIEEEKKRKLELKRIRDEKKEGVDKRREDREIRREEEREKKEEIDRENFEKEKRERDIKNKEEEKDREILSRTTVTPLVFVPRKKTFHNSYEDIHNIKLKELHGDRLLLRRVLELQDIDEIEFRFEVFPGIGPDIVIIVNQCNVFGVDLKCGVNGQKDSWDQKILWDLNPLYLSDYKKSPILYLRFIKWSKSKKENKGFRAYHLTRTKDDDDVLKVYAEQNLKRRRVSEFCM